MKRRAFLTGSVAALSVSLAATAEALSAEQTTDEQRYLDALARAAAAVAEANALAEKLGHFDRWVVTNQVHLDTIGATNQLKGYNRGRDEGFRHGRSEYVGSKLRLSDFRDDPRMPELIEYAERTANDRLRQVYEKVIDQMPGVDRELMMNAGSETALLHIWEAGQRAADGEINLRKWGSLTV